jgi:hypothetical protein
MFTCSDVFGQEIAFPGETDPMLPHEQTFMRRGSRFACMRLFCNDRD